MEYDLSMSVADTWKAWKADLQAAKTAKKSRRRKRRNAAKKERKALQLLPKFIGTYQDYLKSKQWAQRRKMALEHYGHKCETCGSMNRLQVHHRHYKTIFNEMPVDLQVLCCGCHENAHEGEKAGVFDPVARRFMELHL